MRGAGIHLRVLRHESASGIKFREPGPRVLFDPDVVVVTFNAIQTGELDTLFDWLWRVFPARPVLVIPTELDTLDVLQILEMAASDFLLPPLRRSELLPRVIRQALLRRRGHARLEKFKEGPALKQIIGEGPALLQQLRRVPRLRAAMLRFSFQGVRHRQGDFCAGYSQSEPAGQPALCSGELRCDP